MYLSLFMLLCAEFEACTRVEFLYFRPPLPPTVFDDRAMLKNASLCFLEIFILLLECHYNV